MTIILTHTAHNNRTTNLTYNDEHEAAVMAYRMRRSPKTKAVAIAYLEPQPLQKPRTTWATLKSYFLKFWNI